VDRRWFKRRFEALIDAAVLFVALKWIAPFLVKWVAPLALGLMFEPAFLGPLILGIGVILAFGQIKKTLPVVQRI
jgi:hypothetical protein